MAKGTLNQVTLVGNIGKDPTFRTSPSGLGVISFSVATTHSSKNKDGQWEDQTEWTPVVIFGKTAEFLNKYAGKGRKVLVTGRLQTRKWQDKNGMDRWTTEVIGNEAQLLDKNPEGVQQRQAADPVESFAGTEIPFDDDIPF